MRIGVGLTVLDITLSPGVAGSLRVDTGLSRDTPGFEFGRQFTDSLFFGARTALFLRDLGGDEEAFGLTAVPRLELLLASRQRVVPTLGGQMGVTMAVSQGRTIAEFIAGGILGMHVFATRSFSVSPMVEVSYLRDTEVDRDNLRVALVISFSGWFVNR